MATVVTDGRGFEWTFAEDGLVQGTFWNGDPWVYDSGGGLTLTAIAPSRKGTTTSTRHGSVKNPQGSCLDQAFDGRMNNSGGTGNGYTEANQLALPASLAAGDTVVTAWSIESGTTGASDYTAWYVRNVSGTWAANDTFTSNVNTTSGTFFKRFTPNNDYYVYLLKSTSGNLQAGEIITGSQGGVATLFTTFSGKTIGSDLSYIASYGCVTVVDQDLTGTDYFRPPYVGTSKPLYPVSQMNTSLLRNLTLPHNPRVTGNANKLTGSNDGTCGAQNPDMSQRYSLDFDFVGGIPNMNRQGIPHGLCEDYYGGGTIARRYGPRLAQMAVLAHCGGTLQSGQDYSAENIAKYLVQYGLDHYPMIAEDEADNHYNTGGGFPVGRFWPIVFAGLMLDLDSHKTIGATTLSTVTAQNGDGWYKFSEQATFYTPGNFNGSTAYKLARPYESYTRGVPLYGIQEDNASRSTSNPLARIAGTYKYHCLNYAQNGYMHQDATVDDYWNDGDYLCTQIGHSYAGVWMAATWMGAQQYFYDGVELPSGEAPAFFDFMENWLNDQAMAAKGIPPHVVQNQRALRDYGTENAMVVDDDGKADPYTTDNLYLKITVKVTNTSATPTITYKGQTYNCSNVGVGDLTAGSTHIFRFAPRTGASTYNVWVRYPTVAQSSSTGYLDYFQGAVAPTSADNRDLRQFGGDGSGWMRHMYETHFENKKQPVVL